MKFLSARIDSRRKTIFVTAKGVVRDGDAEKHLALLFEDSKYSSEFAVLGDARGIESLDVSSSGIQSLAAFARKNRSRLEGRKLALVATSDTLYGMAKMYQLRGDDSKYAVGVFRAPEAALEWIAKSD